MSKKKKKNYQYSFPFHPLAVDGIGKTEGYGYASTPMIQGQTTLGSLSLFKFHTLDHGKTLAKEYKISIANIKGRLLNNSFKSVLRI